MRIFDPVAISSRLVRVLSAMRVFEPVERAAVRWTGYSLRSWASTSAEGVPYIPSLLLTTIGHRSGRLRSHVLFTLRDGEDFIVVASKAGAPDHPQWYRNLEAAPQAWVRFGRRSIPVRAETVSEEEKRRLWPRLVTAWPRYQHHEERAAPRPIPVVRLRPVR
ncbi:MAG: nitroreductase/quinone reductase family protein [Dehalococcoidia bacterium]